jgi:hypothetical protein
VQPKRGITKMRADCQVPICGAEIRATTFQGRTETDPC